MGVYTDSGIGADTRGVFRIPGSVRTVNALYDYYCADGDADEISSTIRCPNLPAHIKTGTHDVASTFKRLLSGLPGGILGSLTLFDALVAIHSQLKGDPEFPRTKQTKLRARLIALAIGTIRSQLRRDLICAVFGLLSMIGRAAEKAPREDGHSRPLPTADLMGYSALGIVFGPLLVGDLISFYTMRIADPGAGLVVFPVTPPPAKKERWRCKAGEESHPPAQAIDKIHVANSITEMLITHWREVVRQMRSLGALKPDTGRNRPSALVQRIRQTSGLRPSISEFMARKPAEWGSGRPVSGQFDPRGSPIPHTPTPVCRPNSAFEGRDACGSKATNENLPPSLVVQRRRPRSAQPLSNTGVGARATISLLSPPTEELPRFEPDVQQGPDSMEQTHVHPVATPKASGMEDPPSPRPIPNSTPQEQPMTSPGTVLNSPGEANNESTVSVSIDTSSENPTQRTSLSSERKPATPKRFIRFPRGTSTPRRQRKHGRQSSTNERKRFSLRSAAGELEVPSSRETPVEGPATDCRKGTPSTPSARQSTSEAKRASNTPNIGQGPNPPKSTSERKFRDISSSTVRGLIRISRSPKVEDKSLGDDRHKIDLVGRGRSRLAAWRSRRLSSLSTDRGSPVPRSLLRGGDATSILGPRSPRSPRGRDLQRSRPGTRSSSIHRSQNSQGQKPGSASEAQVTGSEVERENRMRADAHILDQEFAECPDSVVSTQVSDQGKSADTVQEVSKSPSGSPPSETLCQPTGQEQHTDRDPAVSYMAMREPLFTPVESAPQLRPGPASRLTSVKSAGTAVKAMAARFENASRDPTLTAHNQKTRSSADIKPSGVASQYTVNPPPVRTPTKSLRKTRPDSVISTRRGVMSAFQHRQLRELREKRERSCDEWPISEGDSVEAAQRKRLSRRSDVLLDRDEITVKTPSSLHVLFQPETSPPPVTITAPTNPPEQQHPRLMPTTPPVPIRNQSRDRGQPATLTVSRTPLPSSTPSPRPGPSFLTPSARQDPEAHIPNPTQAVPLLPHPHPHSEQQQQQHHPHSNQQQQKMPITPHSVTTSTAADIARLREQLARAEQACTMWRARAMRAERRVVLLERVVKVKAQCGGGRYGERCVSAGGGIHTHGGGE